MLTHSNSFILFTTSKPWPIGVLFRKLFKIIIFIIFTLFLLIIFLFAFGFTNFEGIYQIGIKQRMTYVNFFLKIKKKI